jgi:very-short-patch-repair endonuclease/predicted transcriptional regulator of viral defense system
MDTTTKIDQGGADRHQLVAEIATAQHGVITRGQLNEIGISNATIARWISRGLLFRLHPGIYAVGHRAPSRDGLLTGALLACRPTGAIARRTALEVWGVWRVTKRPIDVVVVGRTRPRDGVNVHHSRLLPDDHVRTVRGLRVTSPARTLVDLSLELDARQLANVIHELKYRQLYDREAFARCLRRMHASIGAPVGIVALEMERIGSAGTKSELEQRVLALLLELRLQEPDSNVKVKTPIGWVELDNCWPDARLYLEVDGPPHARMRSQNRDRDRRIGLRHAGWKELRIGYLELDLDRAAVSARLLKVIPS